MKICVIFSIVAIMLFSSFCTTTAQAVDAISLSSGWNFISLPKDPPIKAPGEVLKEVSPNVRIVWGYDNANKSWLNYKSGVTPSLAVMESGKGYWIYMNSSDSISMTNWATPQGSISLYTGWNLIGYNGTDGLPVSDALNTISGQWSIIWNWMAGTWYAKHATLDLSSTIQPITNLYQGKAYWINMVKETTYTVELPSASCGTWDSSVWDNDVWCQ
ncbi:MAG: hypothetical protein WCQ90_10220 [Deltaproteobacteria bacterium]